MLQWLALSVLLPVVSDTPPRVRVPAPAITQVRSAADLIAAARFMNGAPVPATITLPKIANRAEVMDYMSEHYPESAEGDPARMPIAWVFVHESGATHVDQLLVSAGDPALDSLAIAMLNRARFTPANLNGIAVSLWTPVPVELDRQVPPGAQFVPYTVKPQLLNRDFISRRLVAEYPKHLRDAGKGGEVLVWVLVNEEGKPEKVQVRRSSVFPELDAAALRVARSMIFSPARNREGIVRVWIQLPFVFKTQ